MHDGYRLLIHVRNGRVRLYTMNGNDWTKRYPRIVEEAARLREPLIIDAEVVPSAQQHDQPALERFADHSFSRHTSDGRDEG